MPRQRERLRQSDSSVRVLLRSWQTVGEERRDMIMYSTLLSADLT